MENTKLHTIVYNIEQENIISEEESKDEVKNKLEDEVVVDFISQQKADDSSLDDTPFDVENDNMQILLNAA